MEAGTCIPQLLDPAGRSQDKKNKLPWNVLALQKSWRLRSCDSLKLLEYEGGWTAGLKTTSVICQIATKKYDDHDCFQSIMCNILQHAKTKTK